MFRKLPFVFVAGLALGIGLGYWLRSGPLSPKVRYPVPKEWITETEMRLGPKFDGLDERQKFVALRLLNKTSCGCGCSHDSLAECLKQDKRCQTAPEAAEKLLSMVREGKSHTEIRRAITPETDEEGESSPPQKIEVAAWNPFLGPPTAKVTIVAFSDFQCPFCSKVVPELKKVEAAYKNQVRIVFRHQPLPFHPQAMIAAEAAMAAHAQGKFWPMHDRLFANQEDLERPALEKHAKALGLNMGKFKAALDSHQFKSQIEADAKRGSEVGADGTPSFFINGRPLEGAQPFEDFKKIIDEEMVHADKLLAEGTPPSKLYETILAKLDAAPAKPAPTCE